VVEGKKVGLCDSGKTFPPVRHPLFSCFGPKGCLHGHYHRFGNPSQLPSPLQHEYGQFAQHFATQFAPEIMKVYLQQIELYVSGQAWLSKKCQYQILQFFTEWFVLLPFSVPAVLIR
jgi:hypothetical protein